MNQYITKKRKRSEDIVNNDCYIKSTKEIYKYSQSDSEYSENDFHQDNYEAYYDPELSAEEENNNKEISYFNNNISIKKELVSEDNEEINYNQKNESNKSNGTSKSNFSREENASNNSNNSNQANEESDKESNSFERSISDNNNNNNNNSYTQNNQNNPNNNIIYKTSIKNACKKEKTSSNSNSENSSESNKSEKSKSNSSSPPYSDNSSQHYPYTLSETIINKYKIIRHLSNGTFGSVLHVQNLLDKKYYAMKVLIPNPKNKELVEIEAKITKKIIDLDTENISHCIRIYDSFSFFKSGIEYFALVIELLGLSLYDFLKNNNYFGYTISQIQNFAFQIFEGIAFLHSNKIIHTDLKPENILLVNSDYELISKFKELPINVSLRTDQSQSRHESTISTKSNSKSNIKEKKIIYKKLKDTEIRIIDFGSAVEQKDIGNGIICTRQYRSPEVILNCCKWDEKSDVWSVACILIELYTGELLFPTYNNQEQLCLIEKTCGHYPSWMVENSKKKDLQELFINCRKHKSDKVINLKKCKKYEEIKKALMNQRTVWESVCDKHVIFGKFIQDLLVIDPNKRPTAKEALEHEFFRKKFED